jgi:hypothetical protein
MRPGDRDKERELTKIVEHGESARKALIYFEGWIDKKKSAITSRMASSSSEDAVLDMWRQLKLFDQLLKDMKTDIQSGELAMDELEEM